MRFCEVLLDPGQRQREGCALALQTARELRHECAAHRRQRSRHVGDDEDQALRVALRDPHHLVGPGIGQIPLAPARGNPNADSTQILDQRQSQHDRDGPELAEVQRGHRLVGGDEAAQAFGVDPSVAVRNGFERDVVHPGQPGRRTVGKARQLPAVAARQMPLGGADLLFDQVEIVEQPLAGRADAMIRRHRGGQSLADADQGGFIRGEARQELVALMSRRQAMHRRERLAVPLHLVGTEQLRAQRQLFSERPAWRNRGAQPGPELRQVPENRRVAGHQLRRPISRVGPREVIASANVATCRRQADAGGRSGSSPATHTLVKDGSALESLVTSCADAGRPKYK